jgi:hypothetical protein
MSRSTIQRFLVATGALAVITIGAGTSQIAAAEEECSVSDVDYTVVGRLLLKDTQFGAANGVYPLGAGKVRLRFEKGTRGEVRDAKLMSFDLDNHLTVSASFALWSTKVVTESHTSVVNACDGAAHGTLNNGDVVWSTKVDGYHSDGTLDCSGNVCGKFGAPPAGSSPLHEAPAAVAFKPFHFSPDGHTFSMEYTQVSHSDSPRQTGYLALSGRETKRSCVTQIAACQ